VWGNTKWEEAYLLKGSDQLGISKRLLERYEWWDFIPHSDWCEPHAGTGNYIAPYAAGIARKVRLIYIPLCSEVPTIINIEKDLSYKAFYFNLVNSEEYDLGNISADLNGAWRPERPLPVFSDLLLVLEEFTFSQTAS
jgi:hypothetical protein